MFLISRKEWCELIALLQLLTRTKLHWGDLQGLPTRGRSVRIDCVQRREQGVFRTYRRGVNDEGTCIIQITSVPDDSETRESTTLTIDAELWEDATNHAIELLRSAPEGATITIDDPMEAFLDEIEMRSISGVSEGTAHILLGINGQKSLPTAVLYRIGAVPSRILDGGRAANINFLQTGTRFAQPMAQKVNGEGEDIFETAGATTQSISRVIRDRMVMIDRMGSSLKYDDVADKVFRCNLAMIDLHMGRLLAETLRISYLEDLSRLSEILPRIIETNPLKVRQELIDKHHYYEHKFRQLLFACLGGMRPSKIYTGTELLPYYVVLLTPDGTPVLYDATTRETLFRFLLHAVRIERSPLERDHYGILERNNGAYYFKLNLKLSLTKR